MNKILKIILIFIFLTNCSLNQNSKFWTKEKIIKKKVNIEEIFKKEEAFSSELNKNLKISLYTKPINKSFLNNYDNNNGRINYKGSLEKISKFKFSKIKNFHQYNPTISFHNNNIIYFDNKGSILKFNNDSKLIWKKNYYTKTEKKLNPILFFANNKKSLIVADNIAKYYALNINTGELLWSKSNSAPFNSQIKIYKDSFFLIDFENTLRKFSIKDGSEIWNVKTENSLIRSQKKLSIVIVDEKIYFNNSLGDISAIDIKTGELIWQSPTQTSLVADEAFFLKTSDIIADKENLYFSNNKNQFFSMDINTGVLNWEQKINSNLRPTLIDKYIFTVSLEGYLIITEKNSGNIIRITKVLKDKPKFKRIKPFKSSKELNEEVNNEQGNKTKGKYKRISIFNKNKKTSKEQISKITPTGFVVGEDNIYLSTSNGRLLIIDISTGSTTSTIKIDNNKISRPLILDQKMFIITDNSIIKLD